MAVALFAFVVVLEVAVEAEAGAPACFGGVPEAIATGEHVVGGPFVADGALVWTDPGLRRMDLATSKVSSVGGSLGIRADELGPSDDREVLGLTVTSGIVAADVRTGVVRTVVPSQLAPGGPFITVDLPQAMDRRYVYFGRRGTVYPSARWKAGLYRMRRDGSGDAEFLGAPPGPGVPFIVDGEFVYFQRRQPDKRLAIVRRALAPDAPTEVIAYVQQPTNRPKMTIAAGRIYFTADEAIWSAPLTGGTAPVRLADVGGAALTDLMAEPGCLYWADGRTIKRVGLDRKGPGAPETLADDRTYSGGSLATDGRFLYWPDKRNDRLMRVARDARPLGAAPPR